MHLPPSTMTIPSDGIVGPSCRELEDRPAREAPAQTGQQRAQAQHSGHVVKPSSGIPFSSAAVPTNGDDAHGQDFEEILLGSPERQPEAPPQPLPPLPKGVGVPGPLARAFGDDWISSWVI